MKPESNEPEAYLRALADNLPSFEDEQRIRKNLIAQGAVGLTLLSAQAAQAAVTGTAGTVSAGAVSAGAVSAGMATGSALSGGVGSSAASGAVGAAPSLAFSLLGTAKVFVGSVVVASTVTAVSWQGIEEKRLPRGVADDAHEDRKASLLEGKGESPQAASKMVNEHRFGEGVAQPLAMGSGSERQLGKEQGSLGSPAQAQVFSGDLPVTQPGSNPSRDAARRSAASGSATASNSARSRLSIERASRGGVTAGPATLPAESASLPPDSQLIEEAGLLRRALVALRKGDYHGAEGLLSSHQRRFPSGALAIEREKMKERLELERRDR